MAMDLRGVVCVGNIVVDILARPVGELSWGMSTWVDHIQQQLGGNGASTAYTLTKLGVPTQLVGAVGADTFGEFALNQLKRPGTDLKRVSKIHGATATTIVLINKTGERFFLHQPGVSADALSTPIEVHPISTSALSHLHIANIFGVPGLRRRAADSLRVAKHVGYTTSLDTGWDSKGEWLSVLGPCIPYIDFLFLNEDEARMLTGSSTPTVVVNELRRLGAQHVIVKLGPKGSFVAAGDDVFSCRSLDVEVVDTTGAGDTYVAGFLAALHRGADYHRAAQFATAVASLNIQQIGAVTGVLDYDETADWMLARETDQAVKA
jgi:sugar/nucleoside kinase (ribokinase family)